jgi:hypothetical protein
MKRVRMNRKLLGYVGILSALFFMVNGCAHSDKGEESMGMEAQGQGFAPPIYYDFGDVRLPEELKVDDEDSFVYRTPGFSAGVLVLEGRVELYSLIAFFESSMASDNWKFVSSFKSPRTMMLFHKEARWCVINITEKNLKTFVEIWVAPTANELELDLMK